MNDLNIPAIGKEKICSNCLRKLPVKYFLKDNSRSDHLACNCNSCLFPNGSYYRAKFPELYEPGRFPKVDPMNIPALAGRIKGAQITNAKRIQEAGSALTVEAETEETTKTTQKLDLVVN